MKTALNYRETEGKSTGFWVLLGGLAVIILLAGGAVLHMEHSGHWVTGMNNLVVWGTPHVFAVFLIVAASGALNVASVSVPPGDAPRFVLRGGAGQDPRKAISRCGEDNCADDFEDFEILFYYYDRANRIHYPIIGTVENRYGADVLLVPKASGFDALVWVLPAVGFVVGVAALAVAFRRWKLAADETAEATEADRALVDAALREEADDG